MRSYVSLLLFLAACGSQAPADGVSVPQASPEPPQPTGQGDQGTRQVGLPCEPPRAYALALSDGGTVTATFPGTCPPMQDDGSPAIDGPDFHRPIGTPPGFPEPTPPGDPK